MAAASILHFVRVSVGSSCNTCSHKTLIVTKWKMLSPFLLMVVTNSLLQPVQTATPSPEDECVREALVYEISCRNISDRRQTVTDSSRLCQPDLERMAKSSTELVAAQKLFLNTYVSNWLENYFEEVLFYMYALHGWAGGQATYTWSNTVQRLSAAEYKQWRDCTAITSADVNCRLNATWYSNLTQGKSQHYFICRKPINCPNDGMTYELVCRNMSNRLREWADESLLCNSELEHLAGSVSGFLEGVSSFQRGFFPLWMTPRFNRIISRQLRYLFSSGVKFDWSNAVQDLSAAEYARWYNCTMMANADLSCEVNVTWCSQPNQCSDGQYFTCRTPGSAASSPVTTRTSSGQSTAPTVSSAAAASPVTTWTSSGQSTTPTVSSSAASAPVTTWTSSGETTTPLTVATTTTTMFVNDLLCPPENSTDETGRYQWPQLSAGSVTTRPCQHGPRPGSEGEVARRVCVISVHRPILQAEWHKPMTSDCQFESQLTRGLDELAKEKSTPTVVVLNETASLYANRTNQTSTGQPAPLQPQDVNLTTIILENAYNQTPGTGVNEMIISLVMRIMDHILSAPQASIKVSMLNDNTSARLLVVLDKYAQDFNLTSMDILEFISTSSLLAFYAFDYNSSIPLGIAVPHDPGALIVRSPAVLPNTTWFQIPAGLCVEYADLCVEDYKLSLRVVAFYSDALFASSNEVSGRIASINLGDTKFENIAEPLVYLQEFQDPTMECVFWNFTLADGSGRWDDKGCTSETTNQQTYCVCTHLTHFAILLARNTASQTDSAHRVALETITRVGCSLSLIGLLLTVLTLLVSSLRLKNEKQTCQLSNIDFKPLKSLSMPKFLLLQLSLSLMATLVLVLLATKPSDGTTACTVAAAILHYFLLATFLWMLLEGVSVYENIVKPFSFTSLTIKKVLAIAWGFPAIVVGVSLLASTRSYRSQDKQILCIVHGAVFEVTLFTPICVTLLANAFIYVGAMRQMIKARALRKVRTSDQAGQSKQKATLLLKSFMFASLLGLSWITGLFMINDNTVSLQYLFTAFVSIQGLSLFVLQWLANPDVRNLWRQCFKKKKAQCLHQVSIETVEVAFNQRAMHMDAAVDSERRPRSITATTKSIAIDLAPTQKQSVTSESSLLSPVKELKSFL